LLKLFLRRGAYAAFVIEHDGARTGRALIESENKHNGMVQVWFSCFEKKRSMPARCVSQYGQV
jgi:hypothetical protein